MTNKGTEVSTEAGELVSVPCKPQRMMSTKRAGVGRGARMGVEKIVEKVKFKKDESG
jgi:hypothetical protein